MGTVHDTVRNKYVMGTVYATLSYIGNLSQVQHMSLYYIGTVYDNVCII